MLDVSVGATKARALWCVRGAGLAALALLLSLASASALAQDSEVSEGEPVSPATEEPVALEIEGEVSSEIEGESLSSEPMSSELVLLEPESTEPVRIAASEAAMLEDEEPEVTVVTRPRRRAHAGNLLWNAVVGDVVGGAAGALLAVALAALPACRNGESQWLTGFNCASGFAFAAAIGGLVGATLGGPLGVLRIGGATEAGGDAGMALLAGGVGALTGGILTGILVDSLQQPTLALAIGGGTGVLLSTLLSVFLYDGSRPPRGEPALVVRPMVLPTEGGVILGAGGSL
jgi:hypothetical protein